MYVSSNFLTQPAMFELWSKCAVNGCTRRPVHSVPASSGHHTDSPSVAPSGISVPSSEEAEQCPCLSSEKLINWRLGPFLSQHCSCSLADNKVKLLSLDEITHPCEATDGEIITRRLVHKNHHLWQRGSWLSSSSAALQDRLLQLQRFTLGLCKPGLGALSLKENAAFTLSKRSSTRYSSSTDRIQMQSKVIFSVVKITKDLPPSFPLFWVCCRGCGGWAHTVS